MRCYLLFVAIMLSACTLEKQGGDIRATPAPIFGQQWEITQRVATPNGDRVCSVSIGEMDVTLRAHGGAVTPQVALSYNLAPGNRYRVIAGSDIHETTEGTFGPAESKAIINDMMTMPMVYTEVVERVIGFIGGPEWKRWTNNIPTADFAPQYHTCEKYVSARR